MKDVQMPNRKQEYNRKMGDVGKCLLFPVFYTQILLV